jgi:hypothetical protein
MKLLRELELDSMPSAHLSLASASHVTGLRNGRINHLLRDEVENGRLPVFQALPGLPRIRFRDLAQWYENEARRIQDRHRTKSAPPDYRTRPLLNPQRAFAHRCTEYALKTGLLKREPCLYCGAQPADAHHPNHHKPLWIIWLCPFHHGRHHVQVNAAGRKPKPAQIELFPAQSYQKSLPL